MAVREGGSVLPRRKGNATGSEKRVTYINNNNTVTASLVAAGIVYTVQAVRPYTGSHVHRQSSSVSESVPTLLEFRDVYKQEEKLST